MCVFTIDIKENGAVELNVAQVMSTHPSVTALKVICSLSTRKRIKCLKSLS